MKKPLIRIGLPLVLFLFMPACDETTDPDVSAIFEAQLSGSNEVPPVNTSGTGRAIFELNEAETALNYTLTLGSLTGVTMAHIHVGTAGVNGGIVVFLFGPLNPPGLTVGTSEVVETGTITAAEVQAATGFDGEFSTLIAEMRAGRTYVNAHTVAQPAGEVRGQIVLTDD